MFPHNRFGGQLGVLYCLVIQCFIYIGGQGNCGRSQLKGLVGRRVANGQDVQPGEFPWQVKLRSFGTVFCAGVLAHPRFVVTAARCFRNNYNPQLWNAVLGDSGTNLIVHVETIFIYGGYQVDPYRNDLAVVKLAAYKRQDQFQPICLPERNSSFFHQPCILTGWGSVNSDSVFSRKLQKQAVSVVSVDQCGHQTDVLYPSHYFCAASQANGGPCQGDTGGSVICQTDEGPWQLAGLVYEEFGCKTNGLGLGLYTNMVAYVQWIKKLIIKKL